MKKYITRALLFLSLCGALVMSVVATQSIAFARYAPAHFADISSTSGARASIKLSQLSGPPTSKVIVRGTGFGVTERVSITIDTNPVVGTATTSRAGTFSASITIPSYISPGNALVQATGQRSKIVAGATFLVQTNWSMFGDNSRHTRFNSYENMVSPATVGKLSTGWVASTGSVISSSPAIVDGIAYVGSNDGNVYAFDATTGAKLWSYSVGFGLVESSPAVVNGMVYVGQSADVMSANIYALNAMTGAKAWSYTVSGGVASSPTVVDGILYVGAGNDLYALNARTGAKVWSYTTGSGIGYSSPTVANGMVYIGSDKFYALNARTGAEVWSYAVSGGIDSSAAVENGLVYIGDYNGTLYAFNARTGAKAWSYSGIGPDLNSSPAIANNVVYIGGSDGNVNAFNALNGAKLWSYNTGSYIESSPAVANGVVYIGAQDDTLYALNAASGAILWSYSTGNALALQGISSSPAVANGEVYIGSRDGNLYAFCLCG